ncbi:MAG: hypothetical protein RLN72_08760 [Henriciella sp.]
MRLAVLILSLSLAAGACGDGPAASGQPHDFHPKVVLDDFLMIEGNGWTGSLTYLDYSDPKDEVKLPVELDIGRDEQVLKLALTYPTEPQANELVEIEIADDGRLMNDARVMSREEQDGSIEIRTVEDCEDAGRPAECMNIYDLSATRISISRMVTFEGDTEGFQRNIYEFSRPPNS